MYTIIFLYKCYLKLLGSITSTFKSSFFTLSDTMQYVKFTLLSNAKHLVKEKQILNWLKGKKIL